jgi:hypothetical protein
VTLECLLAVPWLGRTHTSQGTGATTTHGLPSWHVQEFGNPRASRRTDLDYCVAAGWIRPAAWVESQVSRRRWVSVPLYRTHTVDALLGGVQDSV